MQCCWQCMQCMITVRFSFSFLPSIQLSTTAHGFCKADSAELPDRPAQLARLRECLSELPVVNFEVLKHLFRHLQQ